jgi:hypothetical protein
VQEYDGIALIGTHHTCHCYKRVRFPVRSLYSSIHLILPDALSPGVHSASEMSTRNLIGGVKRGWHLKMASSPLSMSRLSGKCESIDVSQPYGSTLWIALFLRLYVINYYSVSTKSTRGFEKLWRANKLN